MRRVDVEGKKVLVVNVEGRFCAFEDRCAHQAMELSKGRLEGKVLTCPAHEWQYDVTTGLGVNPRGACLRQFPIKVEGADVQVEVELDTKEHVGPVLLQGGASSEAVLRALLEDNPLATMTERGGYVRVLVPRRCRLSRATVEKHAQTPFRLPADLEILMPSFKGRLTIDAEEVVWEFNGASPQGRP
jgi:toluene monooxygenase system ferredoxin subunit